MRLQASECLPLLCCIVAVLLLNQDLIQCACHRVQSIEGDGAFALVLMVAPPGFLLTVLWHEHCQYNDNFRDSTVTQWYLLGKRHSAHL